MGLELSGKLCPAAVRIGASSHSVSSSFAGGEMCFARNVNEVAVPEPASAVVLLLMAMGVMTRCLLRG